MREQVRTFASRSSFGGALRSRLARASLGSFVLKGVGMVLAFVYSVVLARLLGAGEYGRYEYVIAWIMILVVPAVFGFDKLLVRALPTAIVQRDWAQARGLWRWTSVAVLVLSASLAAVAGGAAWILGGGAAPPAAFWIGCLTLPLMAFATLWEGALRGLHRIVEGQVPIVVVRPVVALTLIVGAVRALSLPPTAVTALAAFAVAAAVAVAISLALITARFPREAQVAEPTYRPSRWITTAFPIMIMGGLTIATTRVGTILVGSLQGAESAGIYSVLVRGSDLVAFALVAVNAAVAPVFAELHASGDHERLQRVVTRSARLILVLSVPIALALLLFGRWYLQLFGDSFTAGLLALRIATLGQVANVSMGSVGMLLVMTGHERPAAAGFAAALIVNVGLGFLLIPTFGLAGAAWAATIGIAFLNAVLAILVYRRLGIHTTVLGAPRRRRQGSE